MAISFVDFSVVVSNGSTGTASASVSPNLPNSTVSGDRVYIFAVSVYSINTPTNWTAAQASVSLGTGAVGAAAGVRHHAVFYRDYDGVWTMPSVTAVSGSAPTLAAGAMSLTKGAGDAWDAPTVTNGSDTTNGTGMSVTGASISIPTGSFVMVGSGTSDNVTMTGSALTASGVTFSGQAERHDNGSATGNDVAIHTHTASVTTGATAAPTFAYTASAATDGGAVIVVQTVSLASVTGTGALTATNATLSGAATLTLTGTGALAATGATASGAATVTLTGTGALTGSAASLSGAGTLKLTGAGTPTAAAATLSGAGTLQLTGAGALTATTATLAGSGTETLTGTGALTGTPAVLAGAGALTLTGTGALTATPGELSGSGTVTEDGVVGGSGALTATPAELAGSGALALAGAGALTAGAATLDAVGVLTIVGACALAAAAAILAGEGEVPVTGRDITVSFGPGHSRSFTAAGGSRSISATGASRSLAAVPEE